MSVHPTPDEYLPRILGTGQSQSRSITELVIVGRDQIEALSKMLALFRDHKVELFGLESQSLPETKLFIITAYVGLEAADRKLEDILILLRSLLVVESAKGMELEGSKYDKFLFPVVALDGSRLVITTAQNLTEVEDYFSKLPLDSGNLVLFATGRQSGLALVRSIRRSHPERNQQGMLAAAEDELRTSGWGLVTFDLSLMERGSVRVVVRDPIMSNVPGATQSWLTFGVSAGILEGIYGMVGHVGRDYAYSQSTKQMRFNLVELSADQKVQRNGR